MRHYGVVCGQFQARRNSQGVNNIIAGQRPVVVTRIGEVAVFPRRPHRISGVSHKPSTVYARGVAFRPAPAAGSRAPGGNGLTAGDAPDGTGLGVSLGWGDDELGAGRV